jgi:hypothetical protein
MLKIVRIALPQEQLQKLTAGERSLFLLLGHTSNQINTLWKLLIVATNEGTKDPVDEKVSAAQIQIFVRLLIGIMREALKLVEKRFWGSPLGKEYVPRLSPQATEALERLKKRFGAPDKFVVIRDNFAFHHPSLNDMEAAFQLAVKSDGDDTDRCMYLQDALLNTFFFISKASLCGPGCGNPSETLRGLGGRSGRHMYMPTKLRERALSGRAERKRPEIVILVEPNPSFWGSCS